MSIDYAFTNDLLDAVVGHLDIPRSFYEKAVARHKSLGEWLCRPDSLVAFLNPVVTAQGSFRYGTVIRPLFASEEYDLDNVATLAAAKMSLTQRQLKELYGAEIKAYARANGINAPVEEKERCWRLRYADEASFHLDTLPGVIEDPAIVAALVHRGVPSELAGLALAITDRRHPDYDRIVRLWLSSNPRGFAQWFEMRARPSAALRLKQLVEARAYASVEDVPPYEWKTPLQRSIQLLKRHRDVMFRDDRDSGPISMIITNLAAHAYNGEAELSTALVNIVERMPEHVNPTRPYVPNPADPAEDYADKWAKDPVLEANFRLWHKQLKADVSKLVGRRDSNGLSSDLHRAFRVELTQDELKRFAGASSHPAVVVAAPAIRIPSAPRPWADGK